MHSETVKTVDFRCSLFIMQAIEETEKKKKAMRKWMKRTMIRAMLGVSEQCDDICWSLWRRKWRKEDEGPERVDIRFLYKFQTDSIVPNNNNFDGIKIWRWKMFRNSRER